MSEHRPSWWTQQGAESADEDYWDLLGSNDFGTHVHQEYTSDECTYDIADEQELVESDSTEDNTPHAQTYEADEVLEIYRIAKQKEYLENNPFPHIVSGLASSEMAENPQEGTSNTPSDLIQPSVDNELLPAVNTATSADREEPSQAEVDSTNTVQTSEDTRQWSKIKEASSVNEDEVLESFFNVLESSQHPEYSANPSGVNTNGLDLGHGSALMPWETLHGTELPETQNLGSDVLQNLFSGDQSLYHGPTQHGLSHVANQLQFDGDQEERSNFQDVPENTHQQMPSFQNLQEDNGLPQFYFELNADELKQIDDLVAGRSFSEVPDTDAHEDQRILKRLEKGKGKSSQYHSHKQRRPVYHSPYSYEAVEDIYNHASSPGRQQLSAFNTPVVDSGYGTARMSRESTNGLIPTTSKQSNHVVGQASHGGTQTIPIINPSTNEADADTDDAEDSDSDDDIDEDVPNDVTFETFEENDRLIVEDPRRKNWGRTGTRNGHEVWFNPKTSKWQPSASHHDMRQRLIARAQAEYPNDRYVHEDETDGLPHGETAFFKPHQYRGPDRDDCADELFAWRDWHPKKDENGKPIKKEKSKYIRKHPGYMYEDGRILLDPHNNPVVNHKSIPLTLSVKTDGSKLQEMVLNPNVRHIDLWARMPRWEHYTDKNGVLQIRELRNKNTRINMPMTRFREKKGTIANGDRQGSDVVRAGLLSFYHHHGFDPVALGNSTRGFPRDLKPWEVKQVRLGNLAKFGARAGSRAVGEEERKEKLEKAVESINKGKKRQAAENLDGDHAATRGTQDEGTVTAGPRKRRRRVKEADAGPAPRDEGYPGQNGDDIQGDLLHRQQQGDFQASLAQQERFNAYSAHQTSFQYPNMPTQPLPVQTQPNLPGAGTAFRYQMQAPRSPYERDSNVGPIDPGYPAYGHMSNPQYVPQPQHQDPPDYTNYVPKPRGNTLAPGGRIIHQAPRQILGKRGQQNAHEVKNNSFPIAQNGVLDSRNLADTMGPQWKQADEQADIHSDVGSSHKRRRNNATPGTQPRHQRRLQPKPSKPRHYGAEGAPIPFAPPEDPFGAVEPVSDFPTDAKGPLMSPEEFFGKMPKFFDENYGLSPNDIGNGTDNLNGTSFNFEGSLGGGDGQLYPPQEQTSSAGLVASQPCGFEGLDYGPVRTDVDQTFYNGQNYEPGPTDVYQDFDNAPNYGPAPTSTEHNFYCEDQPRR